KLRSQCNAETENQSWCGEALPAHRQGLQAPRFAQESHPDEEDQETETTAPGTTTCVAVGRRSSRPYVADEDALTGARDAKSQTWRPRQGPTQKSPEGREGLLRCPQPSAENGEDDRDARGAIRVSRSSREEARVPFAVGHSDQRSSA